jgi:hypothetical protein
MVEWFRNRQWDDDIQAAFDARLGRARDKAQYLNVQAYTLLATHPTVAASLCRRALALNDPLETARAGLYLGTALAAEGDFDGAIDALEAAIEAERREPMHRTAAYLDQALLVAMARRTDMYETVLGRLDARHAGPFDDQMVSALIARALIGHERGDEVAGIASAALESLEGYEADPAILLGNLSVALLKSRLEDIAGRA